MQDHDAVTGDDRGGIAVGTSSMFYSGDSATGRFDPETLVVTRAATMMNMPCSNLRSGVVYVFGSSATLQLASTGTVTHLIEVDALTGAMTRSAALRP